MRIISGQFKSRHLKATPPPGTRPTSDKLRETLFNILGETVRGCTFLDGCAGVGAIGIEAISRGASMVIFVDQSRKAQHLRLDRKHISPIILVEKFLLAGVAQQMQLEVILFIDQIYSLFLLQLQPIYMDLLFLSRP